MLSWKWTKGILETPRSRKSPDGDVLGTILSPKSKSRGAQDRPKIVPKRKKKQRYHWRNCFLSLFAPLAGARGQLSRFGVNCGSIWGRVWVDFVMILNHPRSLLGRSVCLSVCLSVCHLDIQRPVPNRDHCQICTAIISYRRYQDAQLKLHSSTLPLVFDWMSRMFRIRCSNHNPGINRVQTNTRNIQAVPNAKALKPTCKWYEFFLHSVTRRLK